MFAVALMLSVGASGHHCTVPGRVSFAVVLMLRVGPSECHCTVPGGPSLFPPSTLPDFPPLTRGRSSPGGVQEGRRPLRSAPARRGSVIRFLGVWCVVGRARVLTARKAQCHPESPWRDRKGALQATSVRLLAFPFITARHLWWFASVGS